MRNRIIPLIFVLLFGLWGTTAEAARQFSITQPSPTPPGLFDMGTTQSITLRATNTSTGTNTGERIYEMRFRLNGTCSGTPCTATLFSTATAAPAGWTRIAFSTTSVTFRATSWANSIVTGGALDFTLALNAGTSTQDRNETLLDARASFTLDTDFSNGISRTGRVTNTPGTWGSWTLKSLLISSFQTTDTAGTPVSAIAAGISFRLVITVRNISTATQSGIVSDPSPPTATKTGTWTPVTPNCSLTGTSPSPLNLAPGASGTITYTCATASTNSGTVFFTASVRNSTSSATSRPAVSNTLLVSPLSVEIVASPSPCIFPGDTATFRMDVTNNTGSTISNVTPSALTRLGTATIGAFSGPAPASVASLANGVKTSFTWTAPVTGVVPAAGAKPTFWVTGSASANSGAIISPVANSITEDLDDYLAAVAPVTALNAGSSNAEINWSVINRGCNVVREVQILVPSGWTFGNDAYSLVTNTLAQAVETWTNGTTFSAQIDTDRMGLERDGDFNLVFSATPASAGVYNFTVRITDTAVIPRTVDRVTPVTVSPFGTGGANDAAGGVWREEFR